MTELQQLEARIKEIKETQKTLYSEPTKIPTKNIMVFENRVVFKAESESEVKNILLAYEPYKTSHEIKASKTIYIDNCYHIEASNGYYDRKLQISFFLINNFEVQINIDLKNLSNEFQSRYLRLAFRGLYDTETGYVNLQPRSKEFKSIKVRMFDFGHNIASQKWYGGNVTLLDSDVIDYIINYFKTEL